MLPLYQMDTAASSPSPDPASGAARRAGAQNLLVAAALLFLFGAIFCMRLVTYDEPFERDITTYAVIAHEMLGGRPLYADMWDIKPPLIFHIYALAELLLGYGPRAIFGLIVMATTLTMMGVYALVWATTGSRRFSLLAATLWVIVSGTLHLQANQPNVEVFMNASLVWGLYFVQRALGGPRTPPHPNGFSSGKASPQLTCPRASRHWLLLAGLAFGFCSLLKQFALVVPLLIALATLAMVYAGFVSFRKRQLALLFIPAFCLWGLTVAVFVASGLGPDMYRTLVVIGKVYAADPSMAAGPVMRSALPQAVWFLVPLLTLGLVGMGLQRAALPRWLPLLAYALGIVISVVIPAKYFPHYFQLYLPVACIFGAVGLFYLDAVIAGLRAPRPLKMGLRGLLPVVTVLGYALHQYPSYLLNGEQWSMQKYGSTFVHTRELAQVINKLLKPEDTFYQYGMDTGLYFFSGRPVADGMIVYYALYKGPDQKFYNDRLIKNLTLKPPAMVVISPRTEPSEVLEWIKRNYKIVGMSQGFIVAARPDRKYLQGSSHLEP